MPKKNVWKYTQRISIADAPKRGRKSVTTFERTPQWGELRQRLESEKLSPGEEFLVIFTPEELKDLDLKDLKSCKRFLQSWLLRKNMGPRQFFTVHKLVAGDGNHNLSVRYQPPTGRKIS